MKTRKLNSEDAGDFKWAAMLDARKRDTNNRTKYTLVQRNRAMRMHDALCGVCRSDIIRLNYRLKEINIKIGKPFVFDQGAWKVLKASWLAQGVTCKDTPQAMIYTIDRM